MGQALTADVSSPLIAEVKMIMQEADPSKSHPWGTITGDDLEYLKATHVREVPRVVRRARRAIAEGRAELVSAPEGRTETAVHVQPLAPLTRNEPTLDEVQDEDPEDEGMQIRLLPQRSMEHTDVGSATFLPPQPLHGEDETLVVDENDPTIHRNTYYRLRDLRRR